MTLQAGASDSGAIIIPFPAARRVPDPLLGLGEIAEYLGVSRGTVIRMHEAGWLPAFTLGGKLFTRRSALAKPRAELALVGPGLSGRLLAAGEEQ